MSRFLELYSEHRNRQQYPLPSHFVVPFQLSHPSRFDPVVNGAVYYTWKGSSLPIQSGTLLPYSTTSSPVLSNRNGDQPSPANAYLGYAFYYPPTGQTVLIVGYEPSSCALTLRQPCEALTGGQPYAILDTSTAVAIHLPYQDEYGNTVNDYDQAYTNYYIVDETLSSGTNIVARSILLYQASVRMAFLSSPFPAGWSKDDHYTLRRSLPLEKWQITTPSYYNSDPLVGPIGSVITLPQEASSDSDFYTGKYIYFYSNSPPATPNRFIFQPIYGTFYIKYYNGATRQAFVEHDLYYSALPFYPIQDGTFLPGSTPDAPILSNGSRQDRSYRSYSLINERTGEERIITGYVGFTMTATLSAPFTDLRAGDAYRMMTPRGVNITSQSHDNAEGLDYIGTITSVGSSVAYRISLSDLILPNVPLVTGSRAVYYPFLYVELRNVSAAEKAGSDIIYSNNPPSKNCLFIVPLLDIVDPVTSQFVKLSAPGITQTISFKPTDSFEFSVKLPDGSYFEPVQPDLLSPYEPNSLLQVHATFDLTRIA